MAWEVEFTDEFESWCDSLESEEQDAIDVVVGLLKARVPDLAFPYSSKIMNDLTSRAFARKFVPNGERSLR